jgi:hypothetical protein
MGTLKKNVCLLTLAFMVGSIAGNGGVPSGNALAASTSFYGQSATALFERKFADENLSYMLFDIRSGELLASRWDDAARPIPVGSLVKPFTALAYANAHTGFPQYVCRGARDGCWLPHGHGKLGVKAAIAHSCNAYFRFLSKGLTEAQVRAIADRYGAGEISSGAPRASYVGLGDGWRMSALQLAAAYSRLVHSEEQPGVDAVLRGMEEAARTGTGQAIGRAINTAALVKTGTAPCSHAHKATSDGFVVVLLPADSPRTLLLLRRHGSTGAATAEYAAQMLRQLEAHNGGH